MQLLHISSVSQTHLFLSKVIFIHSLIVATEMKVIRGAHRQWNWLLKEILCRAF